MKVADSNAGVSFAPALQPSRRRRRAVVLGLILGLWGAIGIASLFVWRNFTVDDAFIAWRHGFNLVEHGRYSFNPSGERVEAATSPLYGITSAVPALLGIDVVLFFKLLSLAMLGLYTVVALSARADTTTRLLFLLVAVAGPVQSIHLWSGLETAAFVVLATIVSAVGIGVIRLRAAEFGIVAALLVFTRLEGLFFVLPSLWLTYGDGAGFLAMKPKPPLRVGTARALAQLRRAKSAWLPSVCVVLGITAFRLVYFGSVVPNTFVTKSTSASGIRAVIHTVRSNVPPFLVLGLAALIVGFLVARPYRVRYFVILSTAAVASGVLYLPSTLSMNFALRYPFQIYWPIALAGVLAIGTATLTRVVVIALLCGGVNLYYGHKESPARIADYYPRMTNCMLPLGTALHDAPGTQGTLVIGDVGAVPLKSGWYTLDTHFLGTRKSLGIEGIARHISSDPRGVLALYASGPDMKSVRPDNAPLAQAGIQAGYQFVGACMWRDTYWYHVWIGPEIAKFPGTTAALKELLAQSKTKNERMTYRQAIENWYWHS